MTPNDWHAHVYFDAEQLNEARVLCEAMAQTFRVTMGRLHSVPIGPHPRGSCQLTIPHSMIGDGLWWLCQHRGRLPVFVHANTGNDYRDHIAHIIWLGESEVLNLDAFERT